MNSVRAEIVAHPFKYRWPSYHINGQGKKFNLLSPHALYQDLGDELEKATIDKIRKAVPTVPSV